MLRYISIVSCREDVLVGHFAFISSLGHFPSVCFSLIVFYLPFCPFTKRHVYFCEPFALFLYPWLARRNVKYRLLVSLISSAMLMRRSLSWSKYRVKRSRSWPRAQFLHLIIRRLFYTTWSSILTLVYWFGFIFVPERSIWFFFRVVYLTGSFQFLFYSTTVTAV
jgi:hypothetical protein